MVLKLAAYLNCHSPIPIEVMAESFNAAGRAGDDSLYRSAAGEIMPEAAVYMHPFELAWFVSARGSDDEAREAVNHRKAYIARAASLAPMLFSLLNVKNASDLDPVLSRIDNFCRDYLVINTAPHEKKMRKEANSSIQRLVRSAKDLQTRLNECGYHIQGEFNHHKAAVDRGWDADRFADTFEPFQADLHRLVLAAEIVLYRESIGKEGLIIKDNRTKFQAVECTYEMSLWQGAPDFVTTPGSDFSTACSLLYEIASGERDVGLAGAINRFAKSSDREKILAEEQSFQWSNSDAGMRAYEADNFAAVKEQTAMLQGEATFWADIIKSRDWDTLSRRELRDRQADVLERLQRSLTENGPHLVWASQMMRAYTSEMEELKEIDDLLTKTQITLGKARRARNR